MKGFLFWVILNIQFNPDQSLYEKIHNDWKCRPLDMTMSVTEKLSSSEAFSVLGLGLFFFGGEKERETARLGILAYGLSGIATLSLKLIFNRKRPEGVYPRWDSSFPSFHTAASFSLATVFAKEYPSMRIPLFGLASIIGFSRVYLGEHYPSDVVAGAVLGYLVGRIVLSQQDYLNRLHF